jgi:N-acyl-D-amino-acid deacylase
VTVLKFNAELSIRERLNNGTFDLNGLFFGHKTTSSITRSTQVETTGSRRLRTSIRLEVSSPFWQHAVFIATLDPPAATTRTCFRFISDRDLSHFRRLGHPVAGFWKLNRPTDTPACLNVLLAGCPLAQWSLNVFDLMIRGGTVIDGTGTRRRVADVAITGDRIAAVGDLSGSTAASTIDASGLIVAPGFIDVHNHSDGWLLRDPNFAPKTTQGFTTEVLQADGIGYAPVTQQTAREWLFYLRSLDGLRLQDWTGWETFEEFMSALNGRSAQNVASHLPYANIRSMACGFGRAPVDDFQMREIQRQIRIGMQAGAVGVSTGLDYIVQCFSTTDELAEALSAMAPYDGLYVTHIRYKKGLLPGLQEAADIARRAGVRLHISHLKAQTQEQTDEVMDFLETTRRDVDVSFDVYPYQPGSTMLNYLLPYEVWEDGPIAALGKLSEPGLRVRFAAGLDAMRLPLDRIHIAWLQSKENSHWQGKSLLEFVEASGLSAADALLDLMIEERLAGLLVFDEGDDRLVYPFLQHELFMLGSDGIFCSDGPVHPRVYGSAGRFPGPMVRDLKLTTLENAVHKMTGYSAERFRLAGRGTISEGSFADLTIFNADTITDNATFKEPRQKTTGVETVIVNGEVIVRSEEPVESASPPGRSLKAGDAN